ncbi:DUF3179 domain-containing protein [Nonomuraea sp. 10N515B]|uniref:DUF3179 domain-containing protein n=1 Tax=Nonomuraea sp. 10N515B TaxID=3457422 RepID=UPI003FCC928E
MLTSRIAALTVIALVTAACASGDSTGTRPTGASPTPVVLEWSRPSPAEDVPSALDDPAGKDLPRPLVKVDRLVSGGPPPDGIPSIDRPRFQRSDQVGWLADQEPVLAVEVGTHRRAYPVQIMIWHEIVNDTIGGVPVAVTYCPLCNSALAFDRRSAGRTLDFGVSGLLYNSDLVMFDRQTRSLWSQLEGRAVAGMLTGTRLQRVAVATVPFGQWRQANPLGWVLSRDTGVARDYGRNPYLGYDQPGEDPFLFDQKADPRLPPKTRVVGLGHGTDAVAVAVAVTLDRLARERVTELQVAGRPVTIWAQPGLASALDTDQIAQGRTVAATGAFDPVVDGRRLRFSAQSQGEHVTDDATGSRWNLLGEAISGPLKGTRLAKVDHVDTFWFAWVAFSPKTEILS